MSHEPTKPERWALPGFRLDAHSKSGAYARGYEKGWDDRAVHASEAWTLLATLVDEGPYLDDESGMCINCGHYFDLSDARRDPSLHRDDCTWALAATLIKKIEEA